MGKLVIRIVINAIALSVAAYFVPGIELTNEPLQLIIVAAVFGLINAIVKPIVKLLAFPITFLTLGLFLLVINTLMLLLTGWFDIGLSFYGSTFEQFTTAFIASIIISLVSTVLSSLLEDDD